MKPRTSSGHESTDSTATFAHDSSQGDPPRASIVIVNYNGADHLRTCLPSLWDAGCKIEVILVDNASLYGNIAWVEQQYPEIQVFYFSRNKGLGHANNYGARKARSEYLLFLNPDTVATGGWVRELVRALEENPGAGLATPKLLYLEEPELINTCGNTIHISGITLCRGIKQPSNAPAFGVTAQVDAVSGAAFCIKREVFEALGGFDERFFLYMEDTDLSWRARLIGYQSVCVPSATVYHDYELRFGPRKVFYQERNRYLMLLKSLRWRSLLLMFPIFLLAEFITWGWVLWREPHRWRNKWDAYRWIIENWQDVMRSRKIVQATRRVRDRDLLMNCTYSLDFWQAGGDGPIATAAALIFDPVFWALHKGCVSLLRW